MSRTKALSKKLHLNASASPGAKKALLNYVAKSAKELAPVVKSKTPVNSRPEPKQLELDLISCGSRLSGKKVS